MANTAGDIVEITYSHPTLPDGVFYPKSNESNSYDLGGYRSVSDQDLKAGNNELIDQKTNKRGFFEAVVSNDTVVREDDRKASELSADPQHAKWTFRLISGTTYIGTGPVVGDIQPDTNAGTFTLRVEVPQFTKL